jgi:hypothetical protein
MRRRSGWMKGRDGGGGDFGRTVAMKCETRWRRRGKDKGGGGKWKSF